MAKEGALLVLRDGSGSTEWPLKALTVIGRDPDCTISLPDRQVSRRHAVVRRTADGYVLADEDSKNGTWLNGVQVAGPQRLKDGDEVSIAARYKLYYVDAEATAPLVFEGRGLRLDADTLSVFVNGNVLEPALSRPQYELLAILVRAGGALVGREALVQAVWPYAEAEGVSDDAMDALVRRLRLRLAELDPDHPYILTVRGYGYRINMP